MNKRFLDGNLLMHLQPLPSNRPENAILYTATYYFLTKRFLKGQILGLINSLIEDGKVYEAPDARHVTTSHDNMTAIAILLAHFEEQKLLNSIKIFPYFKHPRDFIFLGYLQRKFWAYPLLPILIPIFLYMTLRKYKYRTFGGEDHKIFKADTEILYFLRLNLPKKYWFIHLTSFLIVPLLKLKYGQDWVKTMMDIYYRNPNHPCRTIFNEG